MRKHTLKALAVFALLSASLAATAAVRPESRMNESLTFADKTETKKFEMRVGEQHRRTRLRVKFRMSSGSFTLKLRDAAGKVRQDITLSRDSHYEMDTDNMKPVVGVWTLEVGLKDATGSYAIVWTAE